MMNSERNKKFEITVDGIQSGAIGKWVKTRLTINSIWDAGGEGEKFDVLAAIRKTYNPDSNYNIRGNEKQTPSQIGRSEGFNELSYTRTTPAAAPVIIVAAMLKYSRVEPQPKFKLGTGTQITD